MIVLSLILVIVAAVALIAGFFQGDDLTLIYAAIGACILALIFLGIGVLQRKRARTSPSSGDGYGPGAGRGPVRPAGAQSSRPASSRTDEGDGSSGDETAGTQAAADSGGETATAVVDRGPDTDAEDDPGAGGATAGEAEPVEERRSSTRPVKKVDSRPDAAGSGAEQDADEATGGDEAGDEADAEDLHAFLAGVKGIGPAKQDALVERFGSLQAIRAADVSELSERQGHRAEHGPADQERAGRLTASVVGAPAGRCCAASHCRAATRAERSSGWSR